MRAPNTQIGYQGREGSFTYQALQEYLKDSEQSGRVVGFNTFDDVVRAFNQEQRLTEMFLGTENNNSGVVQAMALLAPDMQGCIVGEHFLHVKQCLLVQQSMVRSDIKEVISQRPALDQCRAHIAEAGWRTRDFPDTALAAEHVSHSPRRDQAAIASPVAGEKYGLKNLGNIADNTTNYTRFLHIVPMSRYSDFLPSYDPDKKFRTTVIIDGPLLKPANLGIIAEHALEMTRCERLPSGSFGLNRFLVDFAAHIQAEPYRRSAKRLSEAGVTMRSIGCYAAKAQPA